MLPCCSVLVSSTLTPPFSCCPLLPVACLLLVTPCHQSLVSGGDTTTTTVGPAPIERHDEALITPTHPTPAASAGFPAAMGSGVATHSRGMPISSSTAAADSTGPHAAYPTHSHPTAVTAGGDRGGHMGNLGRRTTSHSSSSSSSSDNSEGAREGAIHRGLQQEARVVHQSTREVDRALRDIDRQEVEFDRRADRLSPVTAGHSSEPFIPSATTGMTGTAGALPVSHAGVDRGHMFDQGVDRGLTKEAAREERKAEKMDRREDKAAAQVEKHAERREAAEERVEAAAARVSAAEEQLEGTHSSRAMPTTTSSSSSYNTGATGGLPLGVAGPAMGEGYAPVVAPVTIAGEAPGPEMSRPAGVAPTLLAAPAAVGLEGTSGAVTGRGHPVTPGGDEREVRREERRAEKEVRREERRAEKELRRAEKELSKAERQAEKHVSAGGGGEVTWATWGEGVRCSRHPPTFTLCQCPSL